MSDYEAANSGGEMHSSLFLLFLLKMQFATRRKLVWKTSSEESWGWCGCFGKAAVLLVIPAAPS